MRKILTPFVAALLLLLTLAPQAKADYVDDNLTEPLTFKVVSGSSGIRLEKQGSPTQNLNLQYRKSTDNGVTWGEWTNWLTNTTISNPTSPTLGSGWTIQIRGNNPNGFNNSSSKYYRIYFDQPMEISGNIMSMIVGYATDNSDPTVEAASKAALAAANEIPNDYCFYGLFSKPSTASNVKNLNCSNLIFPATKLKDYCYGYLFYNNLNSSVGLNEAPTFLATDFINKKGEAVDHVFDNAFYNCTKATGIHINFSSCTNVANNLNRWIYNISGSPHVLYAPQTFINCAAELSNTARGVASDAMWNIWTKTPWSKDVGPSTHTVTLNVDATDSYGTLTSSSIADVPHGATITVSSNTITINSTTITANPTSATAQYTYNFSAWKNGATTITGNSNTVDNDMTITAHFTRTINQYTVTWKSENGESTLETDANQNFGTTTAFNGTTPTKAATAQYTYTFNGWTTGPNATGDFYANGSTPTVGGNATYYASFAAGLNSYTVSFEKNEEDWGTISNNEIASVPYGTSISISTNQVTIAGTTITATAADATAEYTYAFDNWTKSPNNATVAGDMTITANFTRTAVPYDLTYEGLEGATNSNPASYTVESEFDFAAPGTRDGWTFTGWTCGGEAITSIALGTTGDKTITANWAKVLETFDLEDDHAEGDAYYTTFSSKVTAGERLNIRYVRNFTAGVWATFSLPFGYSFNKEGNNTFKGQVYYLISAEYTKADGYLTLNCMPNTTGIVANKPYVLIPDNDISNPVFNNVALKSIGDGTYSVSNMAGAGEDISFINTQVRGYLPRDKRVIYFSGTSANKLYYSNESKDTKIRAFRGYFYLDIDTDDIHYLPQRVRLVMPDGETIEQTMDEVEGTAAETRKYMENGILVIERNGVKYDAQGHVIK